MPIPRTFRIRRKQRSRERLAAARAEAERLSPAAPRPAGSMLLVRLPGVLLMCGALWLLGMLLADARFRVATVDVRGAQRIPQDQIVEAAGALGRNAFLVPGQALERRLERELGGIATASVHTILPDRVVIAVEEADVAIVWQSGERYWWVGLEGQVYGEAPGPGNLVVVRDLQGVAPEPGDHIVGVPARLARDLYDALPANQFYAYTPDLGLVVFVTASEWPVYLGHEGDAAVKVAVLRALVERLISQGVDVEYVDLRNEHRPTYKTAAAPK